MNQKPLSGSAKRKKKLEREEEIKRTNSKIHSFFSATSSNDLQLRESTATASTSLPSSSSSLQENQNQELQNDAASLAFHPSGKEESVDVPKSNELNINDSSTESEEDNGFDKSRSAQILTSFISPNFNDSVTIKRAFLNQHPIQDVSKCSQKLPFEPSKLFYRTLSNGEKVQRKWLSYSSQLNKVFCSTCMACGEKENRGTSAFITGHEALPKHIYKAVALHENSQYHHNSVTSALQICSERDVESLLDSNQAKMRAKETKTRRLVLQRLIDITLFIGRQGIAYRGNEEAAHSLAQKGNHGNFLELVLLLSEYDVILKTHVQKCIEESKRRRKRWEEKGRKKKSMGRGSLLTFLSKTFINKMIIVIGKMGQQMILKDLSDSITYSLMVDTTQDVAVMDQLAICVRYVVEGKIYERLLDLTVVHDSSGLALFEKLKADLNNYGISISNIAACSFDGASNMKGCYKGLQARFKAANPKIIYTHCMAHVLNLVVADSTVHCIQAENLFGLVEETACFLDDSYKRMNIWKKQTKERYAGSQQLYSLQKIGATRWWSKHKALGSIIDYESIHEPGFDFKLSKQANLFHFLLEINKGMNFDCKTKFKSRNILSQWCKFENIFTAFVVMDLFVVTSPISMYLQSKSLDYSMAWKLVEGMLKQLSEKRKDTEFDRLLENCKKYTTEMQNMFEEVEIETDFPDKRTVKRKRMAGELCEDESSSLSTNLKHKATYFHILDCAINSIKERFVPNKGVLEDCSLLDPKNFKSVVEKDFLEPESIMQTLPVLANVPRTSVISELKQFAEQYDVYKLTLGFKKFETRRKNSNFEDENQNCSNEDEDGEDSEDEETFKQFCNNMEKKDKCSECLSCGFTVLHKLSSQSGLFNNLYCVYKFVMTLPSTQVSCERVFSKLKIIKTKLRNSLSQPLLSNLMLMNCEKDVFECLDKEEIINNIAATSEELKQKLM